MAPPAGGAPPPGGTPPAASPPGDPSALASKAKDALSKAGDVKDKAEQIRDTVEDLAPAEEEDDAQEPASAEVAPEREVVYVDYTQTWQETPSVPRRKTIIVTHVVHPPPPPRAAPKAKPPQRARGFLGFSARGTTTNYNPSAMMGARAGFTWNDRFRVGGVFYSLTARYAGAIVDSRGNELGLRMAYGGLLASWKLYQGRVMDVAMEGVAGAGAACISIDKRSVGRARCIEKVGLVSLEPGIEVGFTVADWARLGFAGGYRFVTREQWRAPNEFTLSGPYVGVNVDFGRFRRPGHK
ncbi:MAG: hypothetical protein K0V04_03045 [Deltaproteobacteria bacterium]|nr:hypothetical protein [Deltaproteobacteria bacterium]